MQDERRKNDRRRFAYYMPVIDNRTQQCLGYLSDISAEGFKLDSQKKVVINADYTMRLDLTSEISRKSDIVFLARAKWSQADPLNPSDYVHGFQIVNIRPDEYAVYKQIVEKFGHPVN
jgi:hypothetical protein